MQAGDTFVLIEKDIDEHLWVVISDPNLNEDQIVIVNLTTHSVLKDQSCILKRGDHPFVKRKTIVNYRDAQITNKKDLDWWVKSEKLESRRRMNSKVLQRIRAGAAQSEWIPQGARQILIDQALITDS